MAKGGAKRVDSPVHGAFEGPILGSPQEFNLCFCVLGRRRHDEAVVDAVRSRARGKACTAAPLCSLSCNENGAKTFEKPILPGPAKPQLLL
ncbi:hypothetical protein EPI10_022146 [Gossypium australe]|uniref:Uncharacterized protein n=1 Tax=Gossypium australe TaxID=47621 RepID=A0A5B6WIT2_9ROSI|nr:hypothetical protein EPI10_022146 [Gossypium australe]